MRIRSSRRVLLGVAAPIAVAALFATACTSSHTASPGGSSSATGSASSASLVTVKTQNGPLGKVLADGSGRALYQFAADTGSKSTCFGACAAAWPPLTATGSVSATGDAASGDLATITRSDGTKQVTYAGHPLYYFAGDSGAGQTNGQGINGFGARWWLVAPSGQKITTSTASAPSSSGGSAVDGSSY